MGVSNISNRMKRFERLLPAKPCKCIDIHVVLWNSKASERMQSNWNVAYFLVPHFSLPRSPRAVVSSWLSIRSFSIFLQHSLFKLCCVCEVANDAADRMTCIETTEFLSESCTFGTFVWFKERTKSLLCSRPSLDLGYIFFFLSPVEIQFFAAHICLWCIFAMQCDV